MDEVSSHVCLNLPFKLTARPRERLFYLVLESHDGRAPGADSEEKREPVSDIDIAVADSLRVLDLKRPIREEADIAGGLSRTKSGLSKTVASRRRVHSLRQFCIKVRQQHDAVLIAAG
jgi:hypothetical protein